MATVFRRNAGEGQNMNAVAKALSIIENLAVFGPSSVTQLSQRLSMDTATVHRNLSTLRERGFVAQRSRDRRYCLTGHLALLGSLTGKRDELFSLTGPAIERLANKFKETVYLATYAEDDLVVTVDASQGTYGSTQPSVLTGGVQAILYTSSLGKCLLAFSEDGVRESLLDKIKYERLTEATITSRKEFKNELMRVRYQGYALDDGEVRPDLFCVGVPIFDKYGSIWAAISISGPKKRILYKRPEIIKELKRCSRELSSSGDLSEPRWRFPED